MLYCCKYAAAEVSKYAAEAELYDVLGPMACLAAESWLFCVPGTMLYCATEQVSYVALRLISYSIAESVLHSRTAVMLCDADVLYSAARSN